MQIFNQGSIGAANSFIKIKMKKAATINDKIEPKIIPLIKSEIPKKMTNPMNIRVPNEKQPIPMFLALSET